MASQKPAQPAAAAPVKAEKAAKPVTPKPAVKRTPATSTKKAGKKVARKAPIRTYTIECKAPMEDKIFDIVAFVNFLKSHLKVAGKAGNLGNEVAVAAAGTRVTIKTSVKFAKRYFKYMTKKFLKKTKVRDWLRVVAPGPKNEYEIRFYNIAAEEEEEENDA
eukprot:m51a1_g9571 putative 60S ribosomal protein L22e (162) ;mRNA; f:923882-924536